MIEIYTRKEKKYLQKRFNYEDTVFIMDQLLFNAEVAFMS
jgi:hypothetical protein